MKRLALVVAAAGCANAYQSARTLAPGKTQATVAVSRTEIVGEEGGDSVWLGDIMIRTGLGERMDGGIRLTRNPGRDETVSLLSFDPKWEISKPGAKTAFSIGVPVGVLWAEEGVDDLDVGAYIVSPSAFIGVQLSPTVEAVFSPKLFAIFPDEDGADSEIELGLSIGLRFTDVAKTYAIHPEFGLLRFSAGGGSDDFVMFGIGISAGN